MGAFSLVTNTYPLTSVPNERLTHAVCMSAICELDQLMRLVRKLATSQEADWDLALHGVAMRGEELTAALVSLVGEGADAARIASRLGLNEKGAHA